MKTIKLQAGEEPPGLFGEIKKTLENGGLVCLPCNGSYRILADLYDEDAVTRLLQSKRRVHKAPSLVFVDGKRALYRVATPESVDEVAKRLIDAFWPGKVTILFEASLDLPDGVVKQLVKANGKIGVRIPDYPMVRRVVEEFGRPLLVSSANKGKKKGAGSPAQIRKNFLGRIDLFIDAGDLPESPSSTVVDIVDGQIVIRREGAVEASRIEGLEAP